MSVSSLQQVHRKVMPRRRCHPSKVQIVAVQQGSSVKRPVPVDAELIGKRTKISNDPAAFVLVCGQNICGQLGLSTAVIERHKPQHLKIANRLQVDERFQSVCAGAMHSCALTVNGLVYTWGCNDDGALGRLTDDIEDEYNPALCVLPEEITSVCAGDSFTVALGKSGRAYISGCFRSSEGVLGLFDHRHVASEPIEIPFDQPIDTIACGADFCLLLTEHGTSFTILCI